MSPIIAYLSRRLKSTFKSITIFTEVLFTLIEDLRKKKNLLGFKEIDFPLTVNLSSKGTPYYKVKKHFIVQFMRVDHAHELSLLPLKQC